MRMQVPMIFLLVVVFDIGFASMTKSKSIKSNTNTIVQQAKKKGFFQSLAQQRNSKSLQKVTQSRSKTDAMMKLLITVPKVHMQRPLGGGCTPRTAEITPVAKTLFSVKIHLLRWKMNVNLPFGTKARTGVTRSACKPVNTPKADVSFKIHLLRWKMNMKLPFGTKARTGVTRRKLVSSTEAITRCRKLVLGKTGSRLMDEVDSPYLGPSCNSPPSFVELS